jgi:copper chaperone CopZ
MTIYPISGMTCMTCVNDIYNALAPKLGKDNVQVSLMPPVLGIIHDQVSHEQLNQWIPSKFKIHPPLSSGEISKTSKSFETEEKPATSFWPLILITLFLLVFTALLPWLRWGKSGMEVMGYFMGGFFIVFSFFKFLNLAGFVRSFTMYDPLARSIPGWAWIYPFLELGLGMTYLFDFFPHHVSGLDWLPHVLTLLIMGTGLIGVVQSVMNKKKIICACLGTVFNLPMTKVTIIEDSIMVAMAAFMLWL